MPFEKPVQLRGLGLGSAERRRTRNFIDVHKALACQMRQPMRNRTGAWGSNSHHQAVVMGDDPSVWVRDRKEGRVEGMQFEELLERIHLAVCRVVGLRDAANFAHVTVV